MKTLLLVLTLSTQAGVLDDILDSKEPDLRVHTPLIMEIRDLQTTPCPQCHVELIYYSYKVEVKDAKLSVVRHDTARGSSYHPVLSPLVFEEKGKVPMRESAQIPQEGLYVGTVAQRCQPPYRAADGSCDRWKTYYTLEGKVEPME